MPVPPKELSVFDAEHPLPKDAANAVALKRTLTEAQEKQLQGADADGQGSLAKFQKIEHAALRAMMTDQLPAGNDVEVVAKGEKTEKDGLLRAS